MGKKVHVLNLSDAFLAQKNCAQCHAPRPSIDLKKKKNLTKEKKN